MREGKTIGIDVRSLMHPPCGGVGEYTQALLKKLFEIDLKNHYILFYNSADDVSNNLPAFKYPNVEYKRFSFPNKIFNAKLTLLKNPKIDKLLEGVDIFFTPNINFLALSKKVKKIITVHDLSFERFPQFYSLKRRAWHNIINPKKLISSQDSIIAVSEHTKKDLTDLYKIKKNKISVIYSGIDQSMQKIGLNDSKMKEIKKRYRLPDNFILYLGTIEPRKNIESIIECFDQLKISGRYNDLHVVIAGAQGWCFEPVIKLAEESKFFKQIHFTNHIPKEDKVYFYNLARLFIFPSYYEGFGFPPLEAQACGTPVISSANSSLSEVLGDSALLITPTLVNEITLAAQLLLDNQDIYSTYSKKGLENSKRFNWTKTAQQTLKLF